MTPHPARQQPIQDIVSVLQHKFFYSQAFVQVALCLI